MADTLFSPRHILLSTDFSEGSRPAFEFATGLAVALDARLTIAHVIPRPDYLAPETLMEAVSVSPPRTIEEITREHAEQSMRTLLAEQQARPARVEPKIVTGDPRAAILELARSGDYDLVVIGTHGRSGLTRLLVGSVAEAIVRQSACPVITVPSHGTKG